ncbi:hypothetical protein BC628DRAFT_1331968 [Trametes gibbosa]|nr:hypothetical protein BC628DRAFT_1331968 [Trametes gibbosa]
MSARVTRKRARTSSTDDDKDSERSSRSSSVPGVASTRDEEFWYGDGNIILIARDVEFRVYRGLLSDHSPVFKDMFSLPQPDDTPVSVDSSTGYSCPVVHLSDSPEDLRHILRVHMPRSVVSPFMSEAPSFDSISASIRLGHKYQMSNLVDHAVEYLKTYYTTDFATWNYSDHNHPVGFEEVLAIGVVNLARLVGQPSLLPTALLTCCGLSGEKIVRGFEREDGSREQLTVDDISLCFDAHPRLVQESVRIALTIMKTSPSDKCANAAECNKIFRRMVRTLDQRAEAITHYDLYFTDVDMFKDSEKLCQVCWTRMNERDRCLRQATWFKLPQLLGIEKEFSQAENTGATEDTTGSVWPTDGM